MSLTALADQFVAAVESGDIEQVVAQYAENGVQHHPLAPEPIRGRDGIRASDGALFRAFPEVAVERRNVFVDDSSIVIELVLRATNTGPLDIGDGRVIPPTGRGIEIPSVWVIEVDDRGLVTEERAYFDSAAFFRQLGLQE